jgi:hypothetical protein
MIVNIDSSPGPGIHWVAALDIGGQRYYNDPLGNHGKTQRAELEQLQPYEFAENDPEQTPEQKDCGVRTLVALMIGVHCGVECFLAWRTTSSELLFSGRWASPSTLTQRPSAARPG